jgi:hypothetical protein
VVSIVDQDGDRGPQRASQAHPGEEARVVFLDGHPPTPPVTLLAAGQVAIDIGAGDRETRWDSLQEADFCGAVGLAGGADA